MNVEPNIDQLPTVRAFAESLCTGDDDRDSMFLTAVTEVFVNAVEAHDAVGTTEAITVTVDDSLVQIADRGPGMSQNSEMATDGGLDRGFGLRIARAGAPGLAWERNEHGGTTFTLPYPARRTMAV